MKFSLGRHGPDGTYSAIVDVGSGSVGVAIVASDPLEDTPRVIWTHRETMSIRDHTNLTATEKNITTTLINAFLELGNTGVRALKDYDGSAKISSIHASFAAPWAYSLIRTIKLGQETEFVVSEDLIEELVEKAYKEASEVVKTEELTSKIDLEKITDETISITANGYTIKKPLNVSVSKLEIAQFIGLVQQKLFLPLIEAADKVLPDVEVTPSTFMYTFYRTLKAKNVDITTACLVDVTAEATEIGIVREGVLRHVTHIPHGTTTLIRNISSCLNIPTSDAIGHLHVDEVKTAELLSAEKKAALEEALETYQNALTEMFTKTKDALAIPTNIFLHTDINYETFLQEQLNLAAIAAHKSTYTFFPVTSKLFPHADCEDTAILLSSYVFHKKLY